MRVGQIVRTAISLPGIPSGTLGTVVEVERVFLAVSFADGRRGYYARRQLNAEGCCQEGEGFTNEEMAPLGVADARVSRGSHLCLLPSSKETAVNATARFVAAGLDHGEVAVCSFPHSWSDYFTYCVSQLGVDRGEAQQRRALTVMSPSELYLASPRFTASAQARRVADVLAALTAEAGRPVRLCGYVQRRHRLPDWWEYEERVTSVISDSGAVALCIYEPAGPRSKVWSRAAALHDTVLRDDTVSPEGLAGP
jgi:hypothetical protein